ncbi:MAG: radical SAM/SPASM domain-containing protein [Tepidisphaerales bacterium]
MLWFDRLRVVLRTMRYREAWSFRPGQSLAFLRYLAQMRPTWRGGVAEINAYTPPVGGESYRRYLAGLRRMSRGQWVPLVAHVSVTDRCAYGCKWCSNFGRLPEDRPLADMRRMIDDLRSAGTARVALTGGEPLLREDLSQIVEICGAEMSPLLFTSGQGMKPGRVRELASAGLAAVFVSLDHSGPGEHDRIRGMAGAFDGAVEAIRRFLDAGIYTAAQAVVTSELLRPGQMDAYLQFCGRIGVHEVMLLEPVPVGPRPVSDAPDPDTRKLLADLHRRSSRDSRLPKVSSMSHLESPECLGCQAGFSFVYISASGDVFPCDFAPASFGNVFEVGMEEILRRLGRTLKGPSQTCLALRLRDLCGPGREYPLQWDETRAVLGDYVPGPPPAMSRCLCKTRACAISPASDRYNGQ